MNHRFGVLAALSITFVLPVSAGAVSAPMSLSQAQAAVSAAQGAANGNRDRIATIPIEFAGGAITFRYGAEPETGTFDTIAHARAALAGRAAYWSSVVSVLAADQSRLSDIVAAEEPLDEAVENPMSQMRELMAASHRRSHADAIRADVAADQAYVEAVAAGAGPSAQQLLDRKAALYRRLTPPAPQPSTSPCP